jgi:methionyl aminopeptidase
MNPKNEDNEEILRITRKAMSNAINVANVGNHIGDIEYQIQQTVVNGKFNVIKDFGGHGCGNKLHEDPLIMC